jgi:hypothetical protein
VTRPDFHGKEGVDGSSPSEGSAKAQLISLFFVRLRLHDLQRAVGMEPFMEPPGSELALKGVGNRRIRRAAGYVFAEHLCSWAGASMGHSSTVAAAIDQRCPDAAARRRANSSSCTFQRGM